MKDFVEKCLNADEEFKPKEGDDDSKANKLDTLKMIFSADRFLMSKLYKEDSIEVLKNPVKLGQFVSEVLNGERPLYWESLKPTPTKHSIKVVGQEFEKRVIDSSQDALLLIYHPLSHKNRGLKEKFE